MRLDDRDLEEIFYRGQPDRMPTLFDDIARILGKPAALKVFKVLHKRKMMKRKGKRVPPEPNLSDILGKANFDHLISELLKKGPFLKQVEDLKSSAQKMLTKKRI